MIDLDIVFVVLTFGCVLFALQTLLDYNKRASAMRPQLNEVLRIKDRDKEELEKVQRLMDESEKEASKSQDEVTALDTKHDELGLKAGELRKKLAEQDDGLKR